MTTQQTPLTRARDLAARGQIQKAIAVYKKAIVADPENPDLLIEAAVTAAGRGRFREAGKLLRQAERLSPNDPVVHLNMGEVARLAGEPEQALEQFQKVLARSPDDADAHFGVGWSLLALNRPEEAVAPLQRAQTLAPRDGEILEALGSALARSEEHEKAIEIFRKLIGLQPHSFEAWQKLASSLFRLDRPEQADRAFERAAELGQLSGVLMTNWARTRLNLRDFPATLEKAEEAIALVPEHGRAHVVKGAALEAMGDFDGAEEALRTAIACDNRLAEAHELLAQIHRLSDDSISHLETLENDPHIKPARRAAAGFALARLYHRRKDYDKAFAALTRANALRAEEVPFDADAAADTVERVMTVYQPAFFEAHAGEGLNDDTPIFILGMPRSGTTLCEQILAGLPSVHAGGERGDFLRLVNMIKDYPESLNEVDPKWAAARAGEILAALKQAGAGAKHVTDKAPGHYLCVGLIHWLFPRAAIIHCRRDPRDIALSCFEQNFARGQSFSYDLDAIAVAYGHYERLMAHWHRTLPGVMLDVQYEDLVSRPEVVAKEMVEFCGLDWDPSCLDTDRVRRPVGTASVWQVRQPINTGSVGKWRKYEKHLKPLIRALEES